MSKHARAIYPDHRFVLSDFIEDGDRGLISTGITRFVIKVTDIIRINTTESGKIKLRTNIIRQIFETRVVYSHRFFQ